MSNTAITPIKPNPLWEMYIQQGNTHMRDGLSSKAKAAYIQAMEIAENILEDALKKQDNMDAIHGFVISCQYLAEVYYVKGLGNETERILHRARNKTLKLMAEDSLSVEFRKEAFQAFHITNMEIVSFYRSCRCHDLVTDILRESKLHSQKFLHEINH